MAARREYDDRGWAVASYLTGLAPWLLFDRTRSVEARRRAADATDLFVTATLVTSLLLAVLKGSLELSGMFLATLPVGSWFFGMTLVGALNAWRGSEWTTPLTLPLARTWFARRVERLT